MISSAEQKIPKGYKQTEVGVIPIDWQVYELNECAKRITDGEHLTPRRLTFGYYLLSARNIQNGHVDLSDVDYVGEEEYRRIRQRCNPETGDVLISCSGTVGRVATVPEGLECVMVRSAALVKLDPKTLSGLYVQYFLQSTAGQKQIFASLNQGAQANLFLNHIQKLRIPLPPTKVEQEAIASALNDTDFLIEKLEMLIEKKILIKQGTMQELLAGKCRLPGFSGKWKTKTLGDLLDYEQPTEYIVKNTKYSDKNLNPVLTAGKTFILGYTDEEFGVFRNLPVIIFDDFTTATKYVSYPFKVKSSAMKILKARNRELNLRFIFEKMQMIDFKLGDHKRYWISEYRNIKIYMPETEEQTAIASILSDMDTEIEKLKSQLDKYRNLKLGMMQSLLTGKIRLHKKLWTNKQ